MEELLIVAGGTVAVSAAMLSPAQRGATRFGGGGGRGAFGLGTAAYYSLLLILFGSIPQGKARTVLFVVHFCERDSSMSCCVTNEAASRNFKFLLPRGLRHSFCTALRSCVSPLWHACSIFLYVRVRTAVVVRRQGRLLEDVNLPR